MKDRIKLLRTTLEMSQKDFGERIGIGDTAVSKFEKGERNPSDQTIKSICREFNVDYFWLTEGFGEMFTNFPETILDELVDEYHLDETDKLVLQTYMEAPEDEKKAIKNFLLTLAENLQKKGE